MKTLLFLLLTVLSTAIWADPIFDREEDQYAPNHDAAQDPRDLRREGMPDYPRDDDLRKLNIRYSRSIYYVDISSIAPGKDNVVRLVTLSISPAGSRNVKYEGFDCGYRRYKEYGYAGSDQKLRPFRVQEWKPIIDEGAGRYRAELVDNYLCGKMAYAAGRGKILTRMKHLKPYKQ